MKTFIYTTESKTSKRMSGHIVTAQVYEVTKNTPKHVLQVASFKGEKSAIMNALAINKILPKKYSEGYYSNNRGNFNIMGL